MINTPTKGNDSKRDGFHIRRIAIERNLGVITLLDMLKAIVDIKSKEIKDETLYIFDLSN
ncbi:carbamoyl phosphate synthase large subunit [Clostridium botulinum B str. Osaka05]|uniref:Carbamoyl phosphate synthase large subunit n=1 Tax=Clostridium botulinum B str. Osaka05 TaxID=1407017 RepID=A0A0S6U5V9_CLOBO|nr:carbamoyl phosphate synthase large subunit [Clostridium botulinum B str. Osaka05]